MATKFTLPPLPYDYKALEPHIDEATLKVHHDKHHQTYTDKFNAALEAAKIEEADILKIFAKISKYPTPVRNHGGGYWNHIFYWNNLAKAGSTKLDGDLKKAIDKDFGSFDKFKEAFTNNAIGVFGSGWTWLCVKDGKLIITNTANQDNNLMDIAAEKAIPIMVIDVWEHAYYLKYQNRRPEHIEQFYNIINWKKVAERYKDALKGKVNL